MSYISKNAVHSIEDFKAIMRLVIENDFSEKYAYSLTGDYKKCPFGSEEYREKVFDVHLNSFKNEFPEKQFKPASLSLLVYYNNKVILFKKEQAEQAKKAIQALDEEDPIEDPEEEEEEEEPTTSDKKESIDDEEEEEDVLVIPPPQKKVRLHVDFSSDSEFQPTQPVQPDNNGNDDEDDVVTVTRSNRSSAQEDNNSVNDNDFQGILERLASFVPLDILNSNSNKDIEAWLLFKFPHWH